MHIVSVEEDRYKNEGSRLPTAVAQPLGIGIGLEKKNGLYTSEEDCLAFDDCLPCSSSPKKFVPASVLKRTRITHSDM